MRLAKLFFASFVFIFGLLFFVPASTSAQSALVPPADLLLHFDDEYFDSGTTNRIDTQISTRSVNATIQKDVKKFGSGSLKLEGTSTSAGQIIGKFLPGKELVLGQGEFTIDFWIHPLSDYNPSSEYSHFLLSNGRNGQSDDRYLLLWRQHGNNYPWARISGYSTTRMQFREFERDIVSTGTSEVEPGDYRTRALTVPGGELDLIPGRWNHVAIQRKNVGGESYFNLSVNGQMGRWKLSVSKSSTATLLNQIAIGSVYFYEGAGFFQGYIDEFRIVKGKAIWRDVPDNGTFAYPTQGDYSNTEVDKNKVSVPVADSINFHTVSLGNTTDTAESNVAYSACPPGSVRPSTREEYLIKLDGTPKLTSYFDVNNKIICTVYWAGNATTTTSKKLKRFEYDTDGQIAREMYYGVDGASVTDVVTYFSKSAGGARQKEIQNRNGTEYYKRYSPTGRLLYEHEYKNGQYTVSRNFTYDGSGRLSSELVFSSPGKYEKIVYTRNGSGVVTQTDSYRAYTPADTSGANYVHTKSTYHTNSTVVAGIIRTYFNKDAGSPTALRSEISGYNTSGVAIDQRTFDYAQNKQKFSTYITTGTESLLGRLKTDEEWSSVDYSYASSSLAYNTSGELVSWIRTDYDDMSAQGAKAGYYGTKYTVYNPKTGLPKEETSYDYHLPSLRWKQANSARYDEKGLLDARWVFEYRDSSSALYGHTSTKYSKEGLIKSISKYDDTTGAALSTESYYGNGEVWYLGKYQYNTPSANQYTANFFRVNYRNSLSTSTATDLVPDGTRVYTKDFVLVSEPSPTDTLSQKKIGDKILESIADSSLRGQAQGGAEKIAIRAVLKALLLDYKNALLTVSEGDPLKNEKRYEIYVAYAWRITRAIYSIEYRLHSGSPKYLNTDKALDSAVTGWYGIDGADLSGNTEFWGLYIRPGAVNYADTEAVYVDMSITNPSSVDFAINISSYDDLKGTPKKIEKWDALRPEKGFSYANNTLSIFNLSGGVGRYITLDEMTKADPTVNLTLNRFEEDMKNAGVNLANLSETALIEKMYEYFNKQSYFSYLSDLSQVAQTVNQTLVRKGGDCEDFGLFFLSLLREEFTRLGNTDAVSRLALVTAHVDENNPVTPQNIGGGHASVGFRQGSQYYYIEGSSLFLGSGADITRPVPRGLNLLSVSGATFAGTAGYGGWHVQASDMYPLLGSRVSFSGSLGVFHDTVSQNNSLDTVVAKVSSINTYLKPYEPVVTTLASSTVQTIPNFKNQSVEFVVESTHSFFSRLAQYVPESGTADVWRGIDQTIPAVINPDGTVNLSAKISGDCEDLAFAEASLLENVLLRYYIAGGAVPDNAVNQAKKNVIIIAEKDYGGVAGRSHLYVGFLTPKTDTSPAVVRLIDPQLGTMGAPQLMSDLYNDKYLFFSDREKVSAITPYDWSSLNFSAAVANAAANGIVLNPSPVDPKAPIAQNLTPTQQAAIIDAIVNPPPPPPTLIQKIVNFAYKASGLKAVVEATSNFERAVRVVVAAALSIGGGPVATAVNVGVALINLASEAMTGKEIIINSSDAGVAVGNAVISIVTSVGGPKSQEAAAAEAAYARGNTAPAPTGAVDANKVIISKDIGIVFVKRESNTTVVHAISPNDRSRTTETRSYNPTTNVMTVTTHTTIVIPLAPITYNYYQPPQPVCPSIATIPSCSSLAVTSTEVTNIPANASFVGTPSTCYSSSVYPSCETLQYNTTWSCNAPLYAMTTASATECTCVDPTASNYGSVATCQYGATISCVGGNPPAGDPTTGLGVDPNTLAVSSYSAPTGEPSSTIPWGYLANATSSNRWCKWSCASGYRLDGARCVLDQAFSCSATFVMPSQASICSGDDVGLDSNTGNVNILRSNNTGCTSATKCEYTCTRGFEKTPGANTCFCPTPPVDPITGNCGSVPVETSQVTLSAARAITPDNYETPTTLQQTITVKKGQAFKLSWAQSNPSVTGSCESTTGIGVFSDSLMNQATQVNWTKSGLNLAGSIEDLKLDKAGSYIFSASCQYGGSFLNSLPSTVRVTVDPSGSFEEF